MYIQDDEILPWISDTAEALSLKEFHTSIGPCPHCRYPVRYPLVARKSDIDILTQMIKSANRVMIDWGITGCLLAEIKSRCFIEIAKEKERNK